MGGPGQVRDIAVARWSSAGPVQHAIAHNDHWVIAGCPMNGPAADRRAGLSMATWFTVVDGPGQAQTESAAPPPPGRSG